MVRTTEGCHRFSDTRSGCGDFRLLSGGLRYAATTGYYLTALQAEPIRYRDCVKTLVGVFLRGHSIFRHLNFPRKLQPQRGVATECHPYNL